MSEENSKPDNLADGLSQATPQEQEASGLAETEKMKLEEAFNVLMGFNEGQIGPDCDPLDCQNDVPSVPGPSATPTGAGDSGKKIKIASWNIKQLTDSDELRLDAISSVISTNGFDVVAIQEIHSQDVLKKIIEKLQPPPGKDWSCVVSTRAGYGQDAWESFGFLYRKTSGIELTASALLRVKIKHDKYNVLDEVMQENTTAVHLTESILQSETLKKENFARKPYLGLFKINEIEFSLITVHNIFSDRERTKREAKTLVKLTQLIDFGKNAIILGDFNLAHTDVAFKGLSYEHKSCIDGPTNLNLDQEYDNIWIREDMEDQFSIGESGVIQGNLTYLDKDGQVQNLSDHHPIFVTLSIK